MSPETLKRHIFTNVVLFCQTRLKLFKKKKHISVNVVSFPDMHAFRRLVANNMKTLVIHVFGNDVLFLHTECYSCPIAFWYLRSLIHVSFNVCFVSLYRILSMHFRMFVRNMLKNFENTHFR